MKNVDDYVEEVSKGMAKHAVLIVNNIFFQDMLDKISLDSRYQKNILYGVPRPGHQEGAVKAHIADLEINLKTLASLGRIPEHYYWKLMVLIHVHDTFKADAKRDSAILDPQSHASLAKNFLAEFCSDEDMLNIVQYHDLGYAVYKKYQQKGYVDEMKLMSGLQYIRDKNLFLTFAVIDACTPSKGREGITWLVTKMNELYQNITIKVEDILPGEKRLAGGIW